MMRSKRRRRLLFMFVIGFLSCYLIINVLPFTSRVPLTERSSELSRGVSDENNLVAMTTLRELNGVTVKEKANNTLVPNAVAQTLPAIPSTTARARDVIVTTVPTPGVANKSNPHPFHYIINNEHLCRTEKPLKYLIYVHSAPDNQQKRNNLRETWGNKNIFKEFSSRIVFLLASTKSQDVQERILKESKLHQDIVQEDFVDSYKNLTYKGIMGLKWASTYCKNAKYVIKSDDDTFLNIFEWLQVIDERPLKRGRSVTCLVWTTMKILRDPKTCMKWCVNETDFPGKIYPRYCSGLTYTFTSDIVGEMYQTSLNTSFFWVDDVYITGLLPRQLANVTYHDVGKHYKLQSNEVLKNYENHSLPLQWYATLATGDMPGKLWQETLERLNDNQRQQLSVEFKEKFSKVFSPGMTTKLPEQIKNTHVNPNTGAKTV